jgi:tRNA-binding protein
VPTNSSDIHAYLTTLKDLVGDEEPIAILEQTPSLIKSLLTGVDANALSTRPSPGKWSIGEIVAHLADSELVFGFRLRLMLTVNGTHLQAFDPDAWASTFAYGAWDAHTSAELFGAFRLGNLRILRHVARPLLENAGRHEEWGTETARGLVRLEAGHDKNHVAQIQSILDGIGATPTFTPSPQKPEIPIDVIDTLDLRVGTIVDIAEVPNVDRLMRLTVDFGTDTRSVIAGIRAERADPRVLVGRQALFYYNLPSKKIRGHVSEAMLCDVGYADGIVPALLEPEWPVPNGTRAG